MKEFVFIFSLLLFIGFFVGCARTLTKNECLEANWHEMGRIDGSNGEPRSKFQEHAQACSPYNVHVGREAYYRGRDRGLKLYCTKDRGYDLGILGKKYNTTCPKDLQSEFHDGYIKGKKVYTSELKLLQLRQRMQILEGQMETKNQQLHSSGISNEERIQLKTDIQNLSREYREIVSDLKYWEGKQRFE
jgi:hypothetical protein